MMLFDLFIIEQQNLDEVLRQFLPNAADTRQAGVYRRTIEMLGDDLLDRILHPRDRMRIFIRLSGRTRAEMAKVMHSLATPLLE
ncbi:MULTISPECIES: hypothetical protein [Sphingobium]|uniref:Uncharacterized protein n=1 Tax=Sphingobium psychrophilum TaxID=2728834 RepID=A0A7X9WYS6_9SPHN|nr:hypothetical protein [Sphingobium psychrophilum]NML12405.1 hypothetical protein [Sphingobium psychrophilum]